jgi:NitT/TauT family transport system ATP-binding protein
MQQSTEVEKKDVAIAFDHVSYLVKTIRHQSFSVLQDLDFSIEEGSFVCIVGPSGCGKTSALNVLAGFIQPTAGQVVIRVDDGKQTQPAMCFQSDTSFGWMSCKENYRFALKNSRRSPAGNGDDQIKEIANLTGLSSFLDFYPKELSGGMRKRLELGRAWLTGSPILLLDEPLGQLDHMTRQSMQLTLQQLWWQERRTVLMITHDNEEALFLSDRVLVMAGPPGKVVGDFKVPFQRPRLDECRYSSEFQELRRTLQKRLEECEHDHN